MDITYLKGVGPKRAELYRKLGIETAEQLIELYPRDYVDLTAPVTVAQAHIGEVCAFRAFVMSKKSPFNEYARMALYKAELSDGTGNITAVFFNTKYAFGRLETGREYIFYGKITGDEIRKQISTPLFVDVSENVLMPKYPLTAGLSNNMVSANVKTALQQVTVAESLPQPLIEKLGLLPRETAVRQIHFPRTRQEYTEARRRLVLEELLTLKLGLSLMKRRGRAHRRSHEAGGYNSAVEGAAVRTYERAEKRRPGLYRGYAAGIPDEPADTGRRWQRQDAGRGGCVVFRVPERPRNHGDGSHGGSGAAALQDLH